MARNLEEEGNLFSPIFQEWYGMVLNGELSEADFGGLYILSYISKRRPKKWSAGLLQEPILNTFFYQSKKLSEIPFILDLLDEKYLRKLFPLQFNDLTVITIFSSIKFTGIKKNTDNFINQSIVYWSIKRRPFILLTYIPTPLQVLRMQANGERVATIFLSADQLSTYHTAQLSYMEGHQNHSKDSFEFFIHDLKHMEHFLDPNTYLEQVGFFISFLQLDSKSPKKKLKNIVTNHTNEMIFSFSNSLSISSQEINQIIDPIITNDFKQLWNELEYLISDM